MSLVSILRKFKQVNSEKNLPEPTFANIYSQEGGFYLEMDGTFFMIEIYYTGSASIQGMPLVGLKYQLNKDKIIITNLFREQSPQNLIFNFGGDLQIEDCTITSFGYHKFKAIIKTKVDNLYVENQKTNWEDDDATLYFEEKVRKRNRTGHSSGRSTSAKRLINPNIIGKHGVIKNIDKEAKITKKEGVGVESPTRAPVKAITKTVATAPIKKPTKGGY